MARAGQDGVEKPLASEEDVLRAVDLLNVHGAASAHGREVPGVHDELLPGAQLVLHHVAVKFGEGDPVAGETLHDEALASEEARPQALIDVDGELDARFAR